MKSELIPISKVKANPNNPRIIKDEKFKKLVKSIQEFPQMLEIRPIVVNEEMIVLGGNMRLKACQESGLKEVHIIKASELTEEQQKEFIIKDNVGFGEWDWNDLANNWESEKFEEFSSKRRDGAEKIADNAKEKGGISMLTYNHFIVKLPYYDKAKKGKFDPEKGKTEYKELLDKLVKASEEVEYEIVIGENNISIEIK